MWFSRLSVDLLWGIIAQFFYGEKKNGGLQKNISFEKWAIFGNFDGKFMFHVKHGCQTNLWVSNKPMGVKQTYGVSRET